MGHTAHAVPPPCGATPNASGTPGYIDLNNDLFAMQRLVTEPKSATEAPHPPGTRGNHIHMTDTISRNPSTRRRRPASNASAILNRFGFQIVTLAEEGGHPSSR